MPDDGALVRKWNQMTPLGPPSLNVWDPCPPFSLFFSLVRDGRTKKREAMQNPMGEDASIVSAWVHVQKWKPIHAITVWCLPWLPSAFHFPFIWRLQVLLQMNILRWKWKARTIWSSGGQGVTARGGSRAHRWSQRVELPGKGQSFLSSFFWNLFFRWLHVAHGILVPWTGIKLVSPALGAQS